MTGYWAAGIPAGIRRTGLTVAALVAATLVSQGALALSEKDADGPAPAAERLRIVISLSEQELKLYKGSKVIETSPVSSGKKGLDTPAGVYSILQKRRWHRSNIYSNAPMPFMQRITWSGLALHAGRLPGYPASHGCVRLPAKFAKALFSMTDVGADVIITKGGSELAPIDHPALFQPTLPRALTTVAANDLGTGTDAPALYLAELSSDTDAENEREVRTNSPIRILITRRNGRERFMDVQRMLAELGHDPGEIDGYLGPATGGAIQAFQRSQGVPPTGMYTEALVEALQKAVGRPEVVGHLYVRQDYTDVFDAPVSLTNADLPLGTHVFSAGNPDETSGRLNWQTVNVDPGSNTHALESLSRVSVPIDIRRRISSMLTPGSSLVISDAGMGRETGKGTDFIVQP